MHKVWLPIVALMFACAGLALSDRAGAAAPSPSLQPPVAGSGSLVEKAACVRRRVCGPRGCAWRTVCR